MRRERGRRVEVERGRTAEPRNSQRHHPGSNDGCGSPSAARHPITKATRRTLPSPPRILVGAICTPLPRASAT
jgi:hypothetical protein